MPFRSRRARKPSPITLADRARDSAQWELAAHLYKDALDRNPENPPIWVQYGHALKEAGHLREAETAYRRAIAYDENDADPHLQLGHVLKIQGKQEEAGAAYLRAYTIDPTLDADLTSLGWPNEILSALRASVGRGPVEATKPPGGLLHWLSPTTWVRATTGRSKMVRTARGGSSDTGIAPPENRSLTDFKKLSPNDLLVREREYIDNADIDRSPLHAPLREFFDEQFYLRANPDVREAGVDALRHFFSYGAREQRDPSKAFQTRAYVKLYPNSSDDPDGPFFAFLKLPIAERRRRHQEMLEWRGPTHRLPIFERYPVANGIFLAVHEARATGAPLIALNLLRSLSRDFRLPVITILLDSTGPLKSAFAMDSVEVIEFDSLLHAYGDPRRTFDEVAHRLTAHRVTHGICNSILTAGVLEKLTGRGFNCLSLVHELTDSIAGYGWERYAETISKQASTVVFPGTQVFDHFIQRYGTPRGNVRVIGQPPNLSFRALQPPDAAERRSRIRAALGLAETDFLVLSAGTGDMRKGIDLYLQTVKAALERSQQRETPIHFAWLGDIPPRDLIWMKKDLQRWCDNGRVLFLGFEQARVADYFIASDFFFLPSREDPFPTVVIEALHAGLPIVGFEGSGGIIEQIGDAGRLAPYGDWSSAADILVDISSSDIAGMREAAFARAHSFSSPESYATDLLNLLQFGITHRERVNERPHSDLVGVGIPAYQCADHIEERVWSIFEQSLIPAEVFAIDDDSTDGTAEAIERLKALAPCPFRMVVNERNSGSPFPQWQRCLEQVDRDFVWLAESDDSARLRFLETLVPLTQNNPDVRLLYANTATMDFYSTEEPAGHNIHLRSVAPLSRWQKTYVRSGKDEISDVLAFENTIPNISACLLHRVAALDAFSSAIRYKAVGDWIFYLALLRKGKIAYCHEQLNLHRRHGTSVITRLESQPIFHIERAGAHMTALSAANLDSSAAERMIEADNEAFGRLVHSSFELERNYLELMQRLLRDIAAGKLTPGARRVLVILPDLHVGGGQLAGVRLANALAENHYVWIYVVAHTPGDASLADRIDSRIGILPDGGFEQLTSFLEAAQIDLISSHVWWSDKLAFKLKEARPEAKWVMTMHGCYERILTEPSIDSWYSKNVATLLRTADAIVYLAEKNLEVFDHYEIPIDPLRVRKIYNGLDLPNEVYRIANSKRQNDQGARSFVMVGRGIEEKGWREAAAALQQVNRRLAAEGDNSVELIFVGSGEFLAKMESEARLSDLPIRFVGAVTDVFPILANADVGLLPSFFPQESLPTVVMEYLFCGLPAIVTDIGEASKMIASESGDAGVIVDFKDGRADIEALADAMYVYATDRDILREHVRRTKSAKKKFSMKRMLQEYSDVIGICLAPEKITVE